MEIFKKTSEFDYIPPEGGWDCLANVSYIMEYLLTKYPNTNLELNRKEFISLMSVFSNEILVSIIIDKNFRIGGSLNKIFKNGFDFRGIKIRLNE